MAELGLQVLAEGDASALRRYHVRQRRTWDCGLACTAAALIRLGLKRGPETDEERDALLSTLEEAVGTYRVWTIDLVKILLDQGVSVHFTTTSFGVQDAYEDLAFYGKLDEDKDRVPRVFEEVRSRGPFLEEVRCLWVWCYMPWKWSACPRNQGTVRAFLVSAALGSNR